jgi:hypothetical protein
LSSGAEKLESFSTEREIPTLREPIMKKTSVGHRHLLAAAAAALVLTLGPGSAIGADSLYVGDGSDDTVKRFDAETGRFLGAFVTHSDKRQLNGPRGMVFDADRNLLVVNQNVDKKRPGEILRYDGETGALLDRLVPRKDANAPTVPRGLVRRQDFLFVAEFSTGVDLPPPPGRVLKYTTGGEFVAALVPPEGTLGTGEFHPRGVVVGPDGRLYVSNFPDLASGLGAQVLRFDPDSGTFIDVFVASVGGASCDCADELNRPEGLVFAPDGRLYLTGFRANADDTDKVVIFEGPLADRPGAYVGRIDLDAVGGPRAFAQALLFGPGGDLFVPITNTPPADTAPATGAVRRYKTADRTFIDFVPPKAQGGALGQPWYLTFGQTDSATLAYVPPGGPNLLNCLCQNRVLISVCAPVDCFSGPAVDAICGPLCASNGGELATGCVPDDPICRAPQAARP